MFKRKISPKKVNNRYKPTYHASVPLGWANDPNGMIWYGDQAHLFFQYYPYATHWGPMHWGHFTSRDFIRWEEQLPALRPDQKYDRPTGCFSGTAIEKDGKLCLMYTGVARFGQQQCVAYSEDGIHFTKSENNPVIRTEDLPQGASGSDFRDPKVFCRDNKYYCIVGTILNGIGDLLLFRSDDMEEWSYVGNLMQADCGEDHKYVRGVMECPDYQVIDGQEILFTSLQELQRTGNCFQNAQPSVWMKGKLDLETGKFTYDRFHELDYGFDFYAPQTMQLPDGRTILIAWKELWGREYPTARDRWVGSFTLPRQLVYREGHLYQNPVKEIKNFRRNRVAMENVAIPQGSGVTLDGVRGNRVELNLKLAVGDAAQAGIKLFRGTSHETLLYYDRKCGRVVFDRSRSGVSIMGREENTDVRVCDVTVDGILSMRIFLDVSCMEVFLQEGYHVMTGNIYADPEKDVGIEFYAVGGNARIIELEKFNIVVS